AVGLDAVRARGESLGLKRTALLDRVRDRRGPDDAPQLSVGSAAELTTLFARIARGEAVNRAVSSRVADWLALNTDLSMVASAFALDPLSHVRSDHGLSLFNKTGSDVGIRADAGVLRGPRASVAYTVTVQFEDDVHTTRLAVLQAMRTIGLDILEYVH
ncbi:MAG TPA: serine hydrolase, partial [Amnibacterium sp.]|nr:serine hydrolase [Amnibacterium sp.]